MRNQCSAANDYDAVKYGDDVKFYTYHHIREQSQELFGFSTLAAKKLFEMLITVQGVGPKAALSILKAWMSPKMFAAIANAETAPTRKSAAAARQKTAERCCFHLE